MMNNSTKEGIKNLLIAVDSYSPEIMETLDVDGFLNMMKEVCHGREYDVLISRYAIGCDKETYASIAARYGLKSGEAIKQNEAKGLRRLRNPKNLKAFLNGKYGIKEEPKIYVKPDLKNAKLDDLKLSVRSYNMLVRKGINTVKDLSERSIEELLQIRNLGPKALKEITDALEREYNIVLK